MGVCGISRLGEEAYIVALRYNDKGDLGVVAWLNGGAGLQHRVKERGFDTTKLRNTAHLSHVPALSDRRALGLIMKPSLRTHTRDADR